MLLDITWNDKHVKRVIKVLNNDYSDILISTKQSTKHFISAVKSGADLRSQYQAAVLNILHVPEQIIYFVREITKQNIIIRFVQVPEFKSLVEFYWQLVRQARTSM